MLVTVLLILCSVVGVITSVLHYCAIRTVWGVPYAKWDVQRSAINWAIIAILFIVIGLVVYLSEMPHALGIGVAVSYMVISLVLGWRNLRYARRCVPHKS